MKRLSAFLILALVACNALAQSPEKVFMKRLKVLSGWLQTVRAAESKYKVDHGVYGDLPALRRAHLLDSLVFESDKPQNSGPDTNFVSVKTHFEVTASSDGQHYEVLISEEATPMLSISVWGNEVSEGALPGVVHLPRDYWDATPT